MTWSFVRCVYWFHPLVHVAARRAALVRELACDEFAARNAPGGVHGYRRTLVDLARSFVETAPSATAFGGTSSMIRVRLEQLEHVSSRSRRELLPALVFTALCVCCIPLGSRVEETVLPSFSDAQGCLQKRFIVLAELARQRTATAHSSDH